jgi:hypothetical protein
MELALLCHIRVQAIEEIATANKRVEHSKNFWDNIHYKRKDLTLSYFNKLSEC